MKKLLAITGFIAVSTAIISCGGAEGNNPGRNYAPDMMMSRAYEAYGYNNVPEDHDLKSRGARYTAAPVAGTVARGDAFPFPIPEGDSGYARAASYVRPQAAPMTKAQRVEAERLYLVNCAICHGSNLDGNGPLWKGGDGPYPAAPRNLKDDYTKALSDGQIYHVITYGKGQMGSYASQLKPEQRWWIIDYMREKAGGSTKAGDTTKAAGAATTTATADTTQKK